METNEEDAFSRDLDMKATEYYQNLMKAKEAKIKKEVAEKNTERDPKGDLKNEN